MIHRWTAWLSMLSSVVSASLAVAGPSGDADVSLIPGASH